MYVCMYVCITSPSDIKNVKICSGPTVYMQLGFIPIKYKLRSMHEIFHFITLFRYDSLKKSELLRPNKVKSAVDALVSRNLVFYICTRITEQGCATKF